jgi:thiol-disulfide isomerase/thioredoxin
MKYILSIIFVSLFSISVCVQHASANGSFRVTGILERPFKGVVYLRYGDKEGHYVTDSVTVYGRRFLFAGQVNQYYANAYIELTERQGTKIVTLKEYKFGLENTAITVSIYGKGFDRIKITGNTTERMVKDFYKRTLDPITKKIDQATKQKKDSAILENLRKAYVRQIELYCTAHPNGLASPAIISNEASYLREQEMRELFNILSSSQQESYFGKFMQRIMHRKALAHTQIGRIMPNFSATSFSGDSITLYGLTKNGYLLLDFWASWCNPCRKASPALRALYTTYHDMGFEILGISCDTKEAEPEWRKAIANDSVFYWHHILTSPPNVPRYPNRLDLLKDYEVGSFPTLILLDKDNKIILRTSSEEDVALKLKELYGK